MEKIKVELQNQNDFNKYRLEGGGRKCQVPKEIEEHIVHGYCKANKTKN